MSSTRAGRETIIAAFDEIDHLRDLLYSAHDGLSKVVDRTSIEDWNYANLNQRRKVLYNAYIAVDELATYLA